MARIREVIANGEGQMPDYGEVLRPVDRWRVAHWVRVLQLGQRAPVAALDADDRARLAAHQTGQEGPE